MVEPKLAFTRLAGDGGCERLLVVGPSLGTSVEALWDAAAGLLGDEVEVVGWDLPGHGRSVPATEPFTVADLAAAVRDGTQALLGESRRHASYAGVSLGGAVGLQLAVDPGPFDEVVSLAAAARIGRPEAWNDRAGVVRQAGTTVMVSASAQRWFAPGFATGHPATANRLLRSLADADAESYALACEALASLDLRTRLADVTVPLLVVAGEHDGVVPPALAAATAAAAPGARMLVLAGSAHLPPAEDPAATAAAIVTMVKEGTHG